MIDVGEIVKMVFGGEGKNRLFSLGILLKYHESIENN